MKVLVAHNRYRSNVPSGENRVVETEVAALRAAGVEVVTYLRSSDEIEFMSRRQRLAVPLQPIHSRRAVSELETLLMAYGPDVVHLHNPYPLISLSVVAAAHRHGVPIVQTVHNHRHSCMRGSYFRDDHSCFRCRGKSLPWPAVQYGCYRDSRLQSIPMALALKAHRKDQRAVDRYVALTDPIAVSLIESGLVEAERVVVRPNSVPDPGPPMAAPRSGLLFIGRLTAEKGVPLLLDAWERASAPLGTLTVIGEGPERPRVEEAARRGIGVHLLGPRTADEVAGALARHAALVVPSTSPEGLPLVVLEAFAHGRPVIATAGGGLPAAVDASVGWLSEPNVESLSRTLCDVRAADLIALGRAARLRYESRFAPDVVIAAQLEVYRSVIEEHARSR